MFYNIIKHMTKEEFFNLMNECYLAKNDNYPNSLFYIYDKQYIRQKKLNRILENEEECFSENGKIYFEVDCKNNYLYVNNNIWHKIGNNYSAISTLISSWINENLQPDIGLSKDIIGLCMDIEPEKFKIFTPTKKYENNIFKKI